MGSWGTRWRVVSYEGSEHINNWYNCKNWIANLKTSNQTLIYSYNLLHTVIDWHRCISRQDYTCDMCEYKFLLSLSIHVYPVALYNTFVITCYHYAHTLHPVSMENQVQDRLSSPRWLMTFAARSVPWSPGWRHVTPIQKRSAGFAESHTGNQLIASVPKASAKVPYKSCSFRTHQGL